MTDFAQLPKLTAEYLDKLSTGERAKLSKNISRELAKSQRQRITSQQNPDGSAYAPRKKRLRDKIKGKVRRKFFTKIKSLKYLKVTSSANNVALAFVGRAARIANVHQHGLRDRAEKNAPITVYDKRELLGFTSAEIQMIDKLLKQHIEK